LGFLIKRVLRIMEIIHIMSLCKVKMKSLFLLLVVIAAVLSCGCLTYSFGDVAYDDGSLDIEIINDGEPKDISVQVTVFDLSGLRQVEIGRYINYVSIESGDNRYSLPVELEEGNYKLYLYILDDGRRSSAVIRDIEVK
jgi:hypothetical protein